MTPVEFQAIIAIAARLGAHDQIELRIAKRDEGSVLSALDVLLRCSDIERRAVLYSYRAGYAQAGAQ